MKNIILGVVRNIITFVCGYLSSKGLADGQNTEAIVTGTIALVSAGWSVYEKFKAKKALEVAIASPAVITKK